MSVNTVEGGVGFAQVTLSNVGSELLDLLVCDSIVPGSPPSYETCKIIYSFHPLGAKMVDGPITMAQSQPREITVPGGPESRLIPAFQREWRNLGIVGADQLIANTMRQARIYGISSLAMGSRGSDPSRAVDWDKLYELDLFFNVLDPLNTAGSLVLDQNPNSPDYQRPRLVRAGGQAWHPSRTVVMMNEQPIYIQFTDSAFGFVGRSVYQRALFPLKSFVQSMITNDLVTKKVGLLIWKAKSPSSAISNRIQQFFGWKRAQLKSGITGNVLQIGAEEDIASLNFQNLEGAAKFARENILKDIATAANMPARMLDQETLVSGFGEGSEDAKQIARFIDRVRIEMQPLYSFCDRVVMRRAWSPSFYEDIQKAYPEDYGRVPYETAFYRWANDFTAEWPNLLTEPDSERIKTEEVRFEAVVSLVETLAPMLPDQENKAALVAWAADEVNNRKELFASPLIIDEQAIADYEPPALPPPDEEGDGDDTEEGEKEPRPKLLSLAKA